MSVMAYPQDAPLYAGSPEGSSRRWLPMAFTGHIENIKDKG